MVASSTNGPASTMRTDRPARASSAATTPPPAPERALGRTRRHVAEREESRPRGEIRDRELEQAQDEPQLPELRGIDGAIERVCRNRRDPIGIGRRNEGGREQAQRRLLRRRE